MSIIQTRQLNHQKVSQQTQILRYNVIENQNELLQYQNDQSDQKTNSILQIQNDDSKTQILIRKRKEPLSASTIIYGKLLQEQQQSTIQSQTLKNTTNIPNTKKFKTLKDNQFKSSQKLFKLLKILIGINKWIPSFTQKLLKHLSKLSNADKYIRLIYAIVKLYRAFNPQNQLGKFSKQLLNARRIIQWQCKYELIHQFKTQQLSIFDVAYKTLQLSGSIFDFSSFLMLMLSNNNEEKSVGSKNLKLLSQLVYSWQDDCYFYQCLIQFLILIIKLIKNSLQLRKICLQNKISMNQFNAEKDIRYLKCRKLVQKHNELKNYIQHSKQKRSNSQQVSMIMLNTLKQKIHQQQKIIEKITKKFYEQTSKQKSQVYKEMIKNCIKLLKFMCDTRTSYNSYSKKIFDLNPIHGGFFSVCSSLLSMYLIWVY